MWELHLMIPDLHAVVVSDSILEYNYLWVNSAMMEIWGKKY